MAFDLSSITRGRRLRAPKVVIYGVPKIGKTTLATSAPNSIILPTEEGLDNIDCAAFPLAKSFEDVISACDSLLHGEHDFQSLGVDSLDWLEPLIQKAVCEQQKVNHIEDIGYGKGHIMCDDLWRNFFSWLDALRDRRNMTIICLAHEKVKKHKNPALQDDYDAYSLKLHDRAVGIITEWADVIGFASHVVLTRKVDSGFNQKETKAIETGKRILHVNPHPAYVAGNRYGMADVDLSWAAFATELNAAMTRPSVAA
ncbi:ATP-binding protein [Burkholderia sp. Bp8990]|uniref:ATP-binding protein n=1 Tax=Burkholderia sp. Bp8990 TaxID=2184552 RepID=UPI000F597EA2|nr:ATP-binding protein [Burkholderia sp. Bp8990]RQS39797.1 oxidoreductase [Burkholderia sp. Bp8990]